MTSILFVTQKLDADDPVLGFVLPQLRALADRGAKVVAVANEVGRIPPDLGAEVVSLGKEAGRRREQRAMRYQFLMARLAQRMRPVTLLVHMSPVYLNLAAPAVRVGRGRLMLWFAHPADSHTLALAERLTDVVLTTLPGSYPRRSPKVRVIGQAVDTTRFAVTPVPVTPGQCRLVAVGRTSPVKGYPVILRALAAARARGVDATVEIVGSPANPGDELYRDGLLALRDSLGLAEAVTIAGSITHEAVAGRLSRATALVNATVAGSADKSVFEAMASGRPVLASNPAFVDLLAGTGVELAYPADDADALADRIVALAAAPADTVQAASAELRARIEAGHSLDHWADAILAVAAELHAGVRRPGGGPRRAAQCG